jgi:hypothetical protein
MKRMSDVFELPVSSNDGNHIYETGSRWHVSQFYGAEKAQHAAHAINHVDALADALEDLIPYCFGGNEEAMNAWAAAKDAITAYRGEK